MGLPVIIKETINFKNLRVEEQFYQLNDKSKKCVSWSLFTNISLLLIFFKKQSAGWTMTRNNIPRESRQFGIVIKTLTPRERCCDKI